ncbi:MAG: hypothetical protein RR957_08475, partial [Oscillospiraceae bacterium]
FMISDIAALPITDLGQPLVIAVIAILLLLVLEVTLSFGAYKNYTLRSFFYGRPSTFSQKAKLIKKKWKISGLALVI